MASALNFAPTAVILVAAATCAWPYLAASEAVPVPSLTDAKAKDKDKSVSDVPLALLNPVLAPRPVRNPFDDHEAMRKEARDRISKLLKEYQEALKSKHVTRTKLVAKKPQTGAARGRSTAGDPQNPLEGLILSGTSAGGARGAAIINGKAFSTGDTIATAGENEPAVLAEVHKGHVVLHYQGAKHELTYSTPVRRESSAKRPAKAGGTAKKGGKGYDPFRP